MSDRTSLSKPSVCGRSTPDGMRCSRSRTGSTPIPNSDTPNKMPTTSSHAPSPPAAFTRRRAPTTCRHAFRADAGSAGPVIAVFCEYDALPDIGHACGHNIIAAAGLGAGLALAEVADDAGGRVVVLGSPAEEGGGGKVLMLQRGALDGIDAALMVHPADRDVESMDTLAVQQVTRPLRRPVGPRGGLPVEGAQRARRRRARLHQRGGTAPAHLARRAGARHLHRGRRQSEHRARARPATFWFVRAANMAGLDAIQRSSSACSPRLEADAAGCEYTRRSGWQNHLRRACSTTAPMVAAYVANAARLGRTVVDPDLVGGVVGSTDMGNVSYVVPSIHPMIKVAAEGVSIHRWSSPSTPLGGRRSGRHRRGQGDGDDRRRSVDVRPACSAGDHDGLRRSSEPFASRSAQRGSAVAPATARAPPVGLAFVTVYVARGLQPERSRHRSGAISRISTVRCLPWSTCPKS